MSESVYKEITFSDADVVNKGNFIPHDEYNPYKVRPWLLHDHGFVVAVVFARNLQDALDEACDADKLDRYKVEENEQMDIDYPEAEGLTVLGSAGEFFDIESLEVIELPNPKFSFCALFNADKETKPCAKIM